MALVIRKEDEGLLVGGGDGRDFPELRGEGRKHEAERARESDRIRCARGRSLLTLTTSSIEMCTAGNETRRKGSRSAVAALSSVAPLAPHQRPSPQLTTPLVKSGEEILQNHSVHPNQAWPLHFRD